MRLGRAYGESGWSGAGGFRRGAPRLKCQRASRSGPSQQRTGRDHRLPVRLLALSAFRIAVNRGSLPSVLGERYVGAAYGLGVYLGLLALIISANTSRWRPVSMPRSRHRWQWALAFLGLNAG